MSDQRDTALGELLKQFKSEAGVQSADTRVLVAAARICQRVVDQRDALRAINSALLAACEAALPFVIVAGAVGPVADNPQGQINCEAAVVQIKSALARGGK